MGVGWYGCIFKDRGYEGWSEDFDLKWVMNVV
jgi:hypothetical protein